MSAAGLLSLTGCTDSLSGSDGGERINWLTPPQGGDAYALCLEFKEILEEFVGQVNLQEIGETDVEVASAAICEELRDDEDSEFGMVRNDVARFAATGTGLQTFEENEADNLRGCATLYPEPVYVIVRSDSNVQSIRDLEGATINTGRSDSATRVNAHLILESFGISSEDFTERNSDLTELVDELRSGRADAAIIVAGWSSEIVGELVGYDEIELLSLGQDDRETILEAQVWYTEDVLPEETYTGIDEPVNVISCRMMIAVNERVEEETVDTVTEGIFENTDRLETKDEFISTENAMDGMSIEADPAASEAIEEADTANNESGSEESEEPAGQESDPETGDPEPESGSEEPGEPTGQESDPEAEPEGGPEDSEEPTGQESDPGTEEPEEPIGQESDSESGPEAGPEEPTGQESDPGTEEPEGPTGQESEPEAGPGYSEEPTEQAPQSNESAEAN